MALTLWAAAEPGPVAWVSLDAYHNRPGVFLSYVVAALRRSGVAVPRAQPAVWGRAAEDLFLLRLAAALAAQDPPVTLVLDDFHVITEPRVLNALDFLVRNVGPSLRVVVSSRTDAPLPVHRYRLAGQLAEIRAADLAFSVAEAGLLLARHGCTLSAHSLEGLTRHTEGWAAGLRLAAICLAAHPDPDRFVDDDLLAEDGALTGFLVEEVFNAQPPEVRELLLSTAILEQVNAEAATELTGDDEAGHILRALVHANAFVQPVGGGWYRYHTLFAQTLRRELWCEFLPGSPHCTDRLPAGISATAGSPTRCGTPPKPATGSSPPTSSSTGWRSARSSSRRVARLRPMSSPPCRTAKPGPNLSRTWSAPRSRCRQAGMGVGRGRAGRGRGSPRAASRRPRDRGSARRRDDPPRRSAPQREPHRGGGRPPPGAEALASKGLQAAGSPNTRGSRPACCPLAGPWSCGRATSMRRYASSIRASPPQPHRAVSPNGPPASASSRWPRPCAAGCAAPRCWPSRRQPPDAGDGRRPPAQHANPAALVALAWVHLEHHELKQTRSRLTQLHAVLAASPDKLIEAIAGLAAAYSALAEGRARHRLCRPWPGRDPAGRFRPGSNES